MGVPGNQHGYVLYDSWEACAASMYLEHALGHHTKRGSVSWVAECTGIQEARQHLLRIHAPVSCRVQS